MNSFLEWFQGLSQSPQLDDQVINSFATLRHWFLGLSANQQYVVLGVIVSSLLVVFAVLKLIRAIAGRLGKAYQRRRIPGNIDLHLDRDNKPD